MKRPAFAGLIRTLLLVLAILLYNTATPAQSQTSKPKARKELRYLFFANGGIVAYFNDGTVAGCPRCEFMRSNIWAMWDTPPHASYKVMKDGSLLVDGKSREYPAFKKSDPDGWALINYKWHIKPPQE